MGLFGTAKSVLVVNTTAVLKTKGVRGRAAPRQQLQLLRALSRIVQREKIKVTAVLVGAPLDKAPHNKVFDGVRVRYAKSEDVLTKELIKSLKQAGSAGVLVAEDVALEKRIIGSGGTTLRVSTFRKLLDDGNEQNENSGNYSNNNNRSQRNDRRDRNRGPRTNRGGNNQRPKPQQQQSAAGESVVEERNERNNGDDTISQMIDLVE